MTRPLSEPSLPGQVNRNKFGVRDLRRRPLAGRWYEPDCTPGGDCKGDEPPLQNNWQQPTTPLEKFAFRRHMDGSLQFKGNPDASGGAVSGSVITTLPGVLTSEPNFLIPGDESRPIVITLDDGVTTTPATMTIDAATGEVTISWTTVGMPSYPYIYREMSTDTPSVISANTAGEAVIFDSSTAANSDLQGYFDEYTSGNPAHETIIEAQGAGSRGVYEFTAGAHWEDPFDANATMLLVAGAFGWGPSVTWKEPYGATGPHRGDLSMVLSFRARIFTASSTILSLQVTHEHASDQTLESAFLEIAYLGPFEGGNAFFVPFGFYN